MKISKHLIGCDLIENKEIIYKKEKNYDIFY